MKKRRIGQIASACLLALAVVALALVAARSSHERSSAAPGPRLVNRHAVDAPFAKKEGGGEADRKGLNGPAQQEYENRAYPHAVIATAQTVGTRSAFAAVRTRTVTSKAPLRAWTALGPSSGLVPDIVTYTGRPTTNSGRVTAMAIGPACSPGACPLYVGAAGGGVWKTPDALAATPQWTSSSAGITSGAIGSLLVDPTDPTGNTLYAGTGEPNGSGDSEAGVGLFKSVDGGASWKLVPGSSAVARDRSVASILVDPGNPQHILIGTALARHGSSSVNGGRRTPPGAPALGLYESTNGGASFSLRFSLPASSTPPGTGSDWFQGGVNELRWDPNTPNTIYAAVFGYGVWRSSPTLDGDSAFHQVFATMNPSDTLGDRTEFALADRGTATRIYVGDSSDDLAASELFRVDNANVPAGQLVAGGANVGWTDLSSTTNGTPGFGSEGFCQGQCGYDMFVASPPGRPDTVWLGGAMNYDEIFGFAPPRSNGRAVIRSTDAGVHITDMTNDSQTPPLGMHPDQHAIVFDPDNPGVAFIGSDGGVVRTSGSYVNRSRDCAGRGLTDQADRADCRAWLSSIPSKLISLNAGLDTIQFQSLSVNPANPTGDIMGGTQDNGTFAFTGSPAWVESVGGDGGQSGVDAVNPDVRIHTYYGPAPDVNFNGTDPLGWDWIGDPLENSGEAASFYVPLVTDPKVGGTAFVGMQHVWRTTDSGGPQAYLDQHCNEYTGDFTVACGDWQPLGGAGGDLTGTSFGTTRAGEYVVATERAPGDTGTLWAGTRIGRLFISKNADSADPAAVTYTRIDKTTTPGRFVSGIWVDPAQPNHAWVSFSGYSAYTPTTPGHVFEVAYNPRTASATWTDRSYNLGDQPITDVVVDPVTGTAYASTDFGVMRLPAGATSWSLAGGGLPPVAVFGLTITPQARVLYAATHGRGAWMLPLS